MKQNRLFQDSSKDGTFELLLHWRNAIGKYASDSDRICIYLSSLGRATEYKIASIKCRNAQIAETGTDTVAVTYALPDEILTM